MKTNTTSQPNETTTASPTETQLASQLRLMAAQKAEWADAAGGSTPDLIAGWSAPLYLLEIRHTLAKLSESSDRIKLFQQVISYAVALQRGSHWTPHIEISRDRLALANEKHRHAVALSQTEPKKRPDVFEPLTEAERKAILDKMDELFGLK